MMQTSSARPAPYLIAANAPALPILVDAFLPGFVEWLRQLPPEPVPVSLPNRDSANMASAAGASFAVPAATQAR